MTADRVKFLLMCYDGISVHSSYNLNFEMSFNRENKAKCLGLKNKTQSIHSGNDNSTCRFGSDNF